MTCDLFSVGMRALLSSEDEPDDDLLEWGRLSELQRRNTLCLPHLKTSYPVETQLRALSEMSEEKLKQPSPQPTNQRKRRTDSEMEGTPEAKRKVGARSLAVTCLPVRTNGPSSSCDQPDHIYELSTPGVKLYKRYNSPDSRAVTRSQTVSSPNQGGSLASLSLKWVSLFSLFLCGN